MILNDIDVGISKKNSIINDYEGKIRILNTQMDLKDAQIDELESELSLKDSQIKNIESKLINRNIKINVLTNELDRIEQNFTNNENEYLEQIKIKDSQINFLKNDLTQKENNFEKEEAKLNNQINSKNTTIKQKDYQLKNQQKELYDKETKLQSLEHSNKKQLSKINNNEYFINSLKDEISNNHLEITYLKNNNLTKKLFSPLSYLYLIIKSNPKEALINIKLYNALKNSDCFDIGFYLNQNKDLVESKWSKYFSLELHYVCNGFKEERTFNKRYFNKKSKNDLLEYILNYDE